MQTRTVTLIKHPSSRNAVHVTGAVNSLLSRAKHEEVFHNMVAFVRRQCVIADHAVYRVVRRMRFRPHTDSLIFRSAMRAREVFGKIMSIHLAHPVELCLQVNVGTAQKIGRGAVEMSDFGAGPDLRLSSSSLRFRRVHGGDAGTMEPMPDYKFYLIGDEGRSPGLSEIT